MKSIILHIHPKRVHYKALELSRTWGLGGLSLVLMLLLTLTGIFLMLVYEPSPGKAYESIIEIQENVMFGPLIRSIHHWGGNLLIIISFMHLLRCYFTGAFHGPRRFNWVIGLFLFFLVLVSNFTGYLLPWDQLAYWAITISTGMLDYLPGLGGDLKSILLEGEEVSAGTLSLFFVIHIIVMPVFLFFFMAYHFWLVRKAGGVVIPPEAKNSQDEKTNLIPTVPNLTTREIAAGLVLIALVLIFATFIDAPLGSKANPGLSPNPTKAPWFLIGIQEMLIHMHPFFAAWVIPVLTVIGMIILPYLRYDNSIEGVWFISQKGRHMGAAAAIFALTLTPLTVIVRDSLIDFTAVLPNIPIYISNGLIPTVILLAVIIGFYLFLKKHYQSSRNEAIQSLAIFLLTAFLILTIICYYFRGNGMDLLWTS